LLYNRLEPTLENQQSCDQAGFRRNRNTTTHLFTTSILQETADGWQIPLWLAAVDFKKAFDSVSHDAIWTAWLWLNKALHHHTFSYLISYTATRQQLSKLTVAVDFSTLNEGPNKETH